MNRHALHTDTAYPATIAGYRALRRLASGERADIVLGHAERDGESTVALKVFHRATDPGSIDREISVLSGCPEGCVPRLLDVGTLPDGRLVLVLERLGGGTVGALLATRGLIQPGEAVTVLAPVVVALGAVHRLGFGHSALGQGTVTLDSNGRPVLTGLGALRDLPAFGAAEEEPAPTRFDLVRADYARLVVLMRSVFDHLDGDSSAARRSEYLAAWFEGAAAALPFAPPLDELERKLFEWAPGLPVRLTADEPGPTLAPARIAFPAPALSQAKLVEAAGSDAPDAPALDNTQPRFRAHRARLPDDLRNALTALFDGTPVAAALKRAVRSLTGRRAPVLAGAALAAVVTVIAVLLLPQRGDAPRTTDTEGRSAASAPAQPVANDPVVSVGPASDPAISGDDPLGAVPQLLAARARCLAATSTPCLHDVDHASSPLLAADTHHVEHSARGEGTPAATDYAGYTASLIERSGNAALVALSPGADAAHAKPASLLMIKSEAGWRLREIFEAVDDPG